MIRNLIGSVLVIVGAYMFQFGYMAMDENMKEKVARKFIENLEREFFK